MKRAATMIAVSLCWAAYSAAWPARPLQIEPGQPFSLRMGESAQRGNGLLLLGFEGVTADSRCARGEQCVWAGDAVVRIWLQRGSGPREILDLHTATGLAKRAIPGVAPDADVRLVRLDPSPIAGTVIASGDYVATLTLTGVSTVDSER